MGKSIQIIPGIPHNDVPKFLAECDILVVPRLKNRVTRLGFPSKLLEYMAMGKTVVVSAVGGMDTMVKDGESGRVYIPGDEAGLIRVLLELRDPVLRKRLGKGARETVQKRFNWDTEMEKFTGLLQRVAP